MSANLELAARRGISADAVEQIGYIHDELVLLIDAYHPSYADYEDTLKLVRAADYKLQDLWKFERDSRYHTWVAKLSKRHFELIWVGRTFRCELTGLVATIPEGIQERDMFHISHHASIDLGVCNGYHRILGGVTEVLDLA